MYKYGLTYYKVEDESRIPESGLDVRLLRPGDDWGSGLPLIESGSSGYYEIMTVDPHEFGFYEIWDNRFGDPAFSGKCCTLGPVDAHGILDNAIQTNHIKDGAITATKIANSSINMNHLSSLSVSLAQINHEIQNEYLGVGDISQASPAVSGVDNMATHTLSKEYKTNPHVVLSSNCDGLIYLKSVTTINKVTTVDVGISRKVTDTSVAYQITAISQDVD